MENSKIEKGGEGKEGKREKKNKSNGLLWLLSQSKIAWLVSGYLTYSKF